jgi:dethiobiotin synthetase
MISDVAKALNLATVLITKPVLGTINQTLLSIEHAKAKGLNIRALILAEVCDNVEFEIQQDFHRTNKAMEAAQLEASLESIERFSGIKFRTVDEVVQDYYKDLSL